MNFKPKFKPKLLLKKVVAALTAVTLSLSLATTALADGFFGDSNGDAKYNFSSDSIKYGFTDWPGQYVSWRVSLYVSTAANGKINPSSHSIVGQRGLGFVGSIYYNNFPSDRILYAQAEYTADIRKTFTANRYPRVSRLYSDADVINGSSTPNGDPIYQKYNNSLLPSQVSESTGTAVKDIIEAGGNDAGSFTATVIEHLNEALGGTSYGDNPNFIPLYNKVLDANACRVGTEAGNKLDAVIDSKGIDGYSVLLPTNDDCVVEWACVVEPTCELRTWDASSFFDVELYNISKSTFFPIRVGINSIGTTLAVDSYSIARYNVYSKVDYTKSTTLATIRQKIPEFQPWHLWYAGTADEAYSVYTSCGKLICQR